VTNSEDETWEYSKTSPNNREWLRNVSIIQLKLRDTAIIHRELYQQLLED